MEHGSLSKNDKDALFDSLQLLNRLTEDCIASDTNTCHNHSDVQTGETTPFRVRQQTFLHVAQSVAQTTSSSDRRQTSTVAASDEASHVQSTASRGGTRAARSPNAHVTARADLMAKSFNHHDLAPLSFGSTNSVNRHSNDRQLCDDRFITCATNGCQTTRISKR